MGMMASQEHDLCMGVVSLDDEEDGLPTNPNNVGSAPAAIVEIEDDAVQLDTALPCQPHAPLAPLSNPAVTTVCEPAMPAALNSAALAFRERTSAILTSVMDEDSQQVFPDDVSEGRDCGHDECLAIVSDDEMDDVGDHLGNISLNGNPGFPSQPGHDDESKEDSVSSCPSPPAELEDSFCVTLKCEVTIDSSFFLGKGFFMCGRKFMRMWLCSWSQLLTPACMLCVPVQ